MEPFHVPFCRLPTVHFQTVGGVCRVILSKWSNRIRLLGGFSVPGRSEMGRELSNQGSHFHLLGIDTMLNLLKRTIRSKAGKHHGVNSYLASLFNHNDGMLIKELRQTLSFVPWQFPTFS